MLIKKVYNDISVITPEITLILGALLILLFGVFSKKAKVNHIFYLSMAIIAISIYQIFNMEAFYYKAFSDSILINTYTKYCKIITLSVGFFISLLLADISRSDNKLRYEIAVLLLTSLTGMCLTISSNSLLTLYLSLELFSLSLYIMIAYQRNNLKSNEAAIKYFTLGALISGIYLFGASLIYGSIGSLNLDNINHFVSALGCYGDKCTTSYVIHTIPPILVLGITLVVITLLFKVSAVPFHMWTPDVYQGSPTIITAFLSTAPKFAASIFLIRFLYDSSVFLSGTFQYILVCIAIISMLFANIAAIMQKNIKRLLAYSSIGHIGFVLVAIATFNKDNIYISIFYLISYLTMSLAIFALILMLKRNNKPQEKISQLAGLAKSHPYVAFAISCIMFSMAGIPPLLGFFSKFYVLFAAIKSHMYGLAIAGIFATIIGCFYYLYIIKIIYFDEPSEENDMKIEKSFSTIIISVLAVILNIFYIIIPEPLIDFSKYIVKVFLN